MTRRATHVEAKQRSAYARYSPGREPGQDAIFAGIAMSDKFDWKQFLSQPDTVAATVPPATLFGVLTRNVNLPRGWASMVVKSGGEQRIIPAGGSISATDVEEVMLFRSEPFSVSIEANSLATSDGLFCDARVDLTLRVPLDAGEASSLIRTLFADRKEVRRNNVTRYLADPVRDALVRLVKEVPAEPLVDGETEESVGRKLVVELEGVCFSAGLVVEGKPSLAFSSKQLSRVRRSKSEVARAKQEHEAAGALREAAAAARRDRLDQLVQLLDRLHELSDSDPNADIATLLGSFAEHERGQLYEAILFAKPKCQETKQVVIAAGDELLFFAKDQWDKPTRRLTMKGEVGGIRSIQSTRNQAGQSRILLGAGCGVYLLDPLLDAANETYLVTGAETPRGGFNSAVMHEGRIYATHSELGVCMWQLDEPNNAKRLFTDLTESAKTIRAVIQHDGDLIFSMDDRIVRFTPREEMPEPVGIYLGSSTTITAICPAKSGMLAGNARGELLWWRAGTLDRTERLHAGSQRPVESVHLLELGGVPGIYFTDTSLYAHARVLGDNFSARYEAGGQTIKKLESAPDLLVGTTEVGDRILIWSPDQPHRPIASIIVHEMTNRWVKDVCLLT